MYWRIDGPGILNDTIIPGYGITEFPVNLPVFNSLPDSTIRSFGGDNQYVQYGNPMMSPLEKILASNFTSPNHISQWDPMLLTLGGIPTQQTTTNPFLQRQGLESAYNYGAMLMSQAMETQQAQSLTQTMGTSLNSMENGLKSLLNDNHLSDEQKAKVKEMLKKVENLKKEIAEQLQNNPSLEDLKAMAEMVKELQDEVSELIDEITEEIRDREPGDDGDHVDDDGNEDGNNSPSKNDKKTGRPEELGPAPKKSELEAICSGIDSAYAFSWGTDKEKLDANLALLNEGNIIEVITHWNNNYKTNSSKDSNSASWNDGEFFASMMDELNDTEQKNRIPSILAALTKRAEALDIYDDIQKYVGAINHELNKENLWTGWAGDSGIDDTVLINNLKSIYNAIVKAEKGNVNKAKQKENENKTDKTKKDEEAKKAIEKKREKVVDQKKAELAIELKRALNLKETPQLSENIEIKTDKKGDFECFEVNIKVGDYTVTCKGKTYSELVKELEKYDMDPKDALIKKAVTA